MCDPAAIGASTQVIFGISPNTRLETALLCSFSTVTEAIGSPSAYNSYKIVYWKAAAGPIVTSTSAIESIFKDCPSVVNTASVNARTCVESGSGKALAVCVELSVLPAPSTPVGPVGPVGPMAPSAPVGPVGPVGPMAPSAPVGPVGTIIYAPNITKIISIILQLCK